MSTPNVLRIDDYRDRREQRLRLAESLHAADPGRTSLLGHISRAARVTGADRAAIVWVDEYGPGLVHPHVVLDFVSDRPRRTFAVEPLRKAWELGVPGALDERTERHSLMAVALGSDGTRAWFLVADANGPRPLLDGKARERVMFLAGECSSVVLHRDLETLARERKGASSRFAGWAILQDVDSEKMDEAESQRIAQRFAVGRLIRMLLDDDLTVPSDRVIEQVARAREEIAAAPLGLREAELWSRVLDALEVNDIEGLAPALLTLGEEVEEAGHVNGALELYRYGYDLAAATAAPRVAIDAARFMGRVLRRAAQWDECLTWYQRAREIAQAAGLKDRVARALAGVALMQRQRGNLPAAREGLIAALEPAEESGDRDTVGSIYHDLLSIEQVSGNLDQALRYGWLAVRTYQTEEARLRGLAALAGALQTAGDHTSAEDAWAVVAQRTRDSYYRTYAWDALAYLAALRGDAGAFERRAAKCDAQGWEQAGATTKAEILYYRGASYRALGRAVEAREWLQRCMAFTQEHSLNELYFRAEQTLADLSAEHSRPEPIPPTPTELRVRLRELRVELVGAEV